MLIHFSFFKRFISFLIFLHYLYPVSAQVLKGKITSESGNPIPYSTVYIQELKQGTTANTKGDYELKLPAGKYLVTYQSLGYSPVFYDITLKDETITRNVVLPVQYYEIPEVRISASGEDPAYHIMRRAIGMAPYYLNNISYYKAEVYIKGNLVFNRIPRLLKKSMTIDDRDDGSSRGTPISEGEVYMMESFNEIEYTAPDKYVQKVISVNSTFPDQGNDISPMDIIQASFYQPLLAGIAISPLSPQAFSYYRFKYQGATLQGNNTINKIQVIPRMKSQQLFEGTIYIIEDLWCLHSVDLTNDNIAGKLSIGQLYIPVQDDIWMPVSLKFGINIGILGVRADAGYGSSVKYLEVKPNLTLAKPGTAGGSYSGIPVTAVTDKVLSKNQEKIEKILGKEELSNRDMVALSRLVNRESERSQPDSIRNNLEVRDNTIQTVEKDAGNRDSTYWAEIRPIPLSDLEMRSIRVRDSIENEMPLKEILSDTVPHGNQIKKNKFFRTLKDFGSGHTWSDTSGFSFTFGGLLELENLRFNTVDGFTYGLDFRISKILKNKSSFTIAPELDYAFSRETLMWRVNGNYSFSNMNSQQVFFRTGRMSRDIGTGGSINTFLNSVTSLFLKKNYLKLYESRYLAFGYRGQISKDLRVELTAGYDDRRVLENTTDFSFFRRSWEYTINTPDNPYLAEEADPINFLRDQRHYEFVTNVTFTPRQKYRISNGAKIPTGGSDWPTIILTWKHGLNEFTELTGGYRHFDMIRLEASKTYNPGALSELSWRARTGGFLYDSPLAFYDFFHFNAQPFPVLIDDYEDSFMLPDFYSLSTTAFYGEVHIKYTTPYLLLKYLPGLSKTLMRENVTLSYLGARYHKSYTEIGYSISEVFLFGELGIYFGFDNLKFRIAGMKLVLRLG